LTLDPEETDNVLRSSDGGLMKRFSRPIRTPANLSDSVHHRLNMYALAASAAGVGILASAPAAGGKVVYTPAHDKLGTGMVHPIDLNHDGVTDFTLVGGGREGGQWLSICDHSLMPSSGGKAFYCKSRTDFPNAAIATSGGEFAAALRKGVRIGKGQQFGSMGEAQEMADARTCCSSWRGPWVDNGKGIKVGYLGFRFKIRKEIHYGWARLCVKTHVDGDGYYFTTTLEGYAYETIPNKAIIAGETKGADDFVPELGSLGALAAGAPAKSASQGTASAAVSH
jgi:hypothetical protein